MKAALLLLCLCITSVASALPNPRQIVCVTERGDSFYAKNGQWNAIQFAAVLPNNDPYVSVTLLKYDQVNPQLLEGRILKSTPEIWAFPKSAGFVFYKGLNFPTVGSFQNAKKEVFFFALKGMNYGRLMMDLKTPYTETRLSCAPIQEYDRY